MFTLFTIQSGVLTGKSENIRDGKTDIIEWFYLTGEIDSGIVHVTTSY